MAIEIRDVAGDPGTHGPMFVCDGCHRVIERDGVFLWNSEERSAIYFAHRDVSPGDKCHATAEARHDATSWEHLMNFPLWLLGNYDGAGDSGRPDECRAKYLRNLPRAEAR
jgi:hypothetical protein